MLIFKINVPAAGYFDGSVLYDAGEYGTLWVCSIDSDSPTDACYIICDSDRVNISNECRFDGFTVRGVCE